MLPSRAVNPVMRGSGLANGERCRTADGVIGGTLPLTGKRNDPTPGFAGPDLVARHGTLNHEADRIPFVLFATE
jgi:hypothetical protein